MCSFTERKVNVWSCLNLVLWVNHLWSRWNIRKYPLRTWIRSVLYLSGVSSPRRTCRASRTLPSSRYSRYFCCSSRNFIRWGGEEDNIKTMNKSKNPVFIRLKWSKKALMNTSLKYLKVPYSREIDSLTVLKVKFEIIVNLQTVYILTSVIYQHNL